MSRTGVPITATALAMLAFVAIARDRAKAQTEFQNWPTGR